MKLKETLKSFTKSNKIVFCLFVGIFLIGIFLLLPAVRTFIVQLVPNLLHRPLRKPEKWMRFLFSLGIKTIVGSVLCSILYLFKEKVLSLRKRLQLNIFFEKLTLNNESYDLKLNKVDAVFIPLIAIITFSVTFFFSLYGFDPHHNGFMFKTSLDISHGLVMYKETSSQYGIVCFVIMALFIKILGETVLSIRFATSFFYMLCYVISYFIYKRILSKSLAFFSCLLTLCFAPFYLWHFHCWSSVYALFFLLVALLCCIKYIETTSLIYVIISTISSIFCFFSRQPVGLVTILAICLTWSLASLMKFCFPARKRFIIVFSATFFVMLLTFLSYLIITGSFKAFYEQSIKNMISFVKRATDLPSSDLSNVKMSLKIKMLFKRFQRSVLGCLFMTWVDGGSEKDLVWRFAPLSCLLVFFTIFIKRLNFMIKKTSKNGNGFTAKNTMIMLTISIFCCASWHQYFPVICLRHMFWAVFPMIGLMVYVTKSLVEFLFTGFNGSILKKPYFVVLSTIIVSLFVNFIAIERRMVGAYNKISTNTKTVSSEYCDFLKGVKLLPEVAEYYDCLHKTIGELKRQNPNAMVKNYAPYFYYFDCLSDKNLKLETDGNICYIAITYQDKPIKGYSIYRLLPGHSGAGLDSGSGVSGGSGWPQRPTMIMIKSENKGE